jgi:3,4-dihydroxy 2-butanone 4-phosphate synthase/GTP cyclohydrolase II
MRTARVVAVARAVDALRRGEPIVVVDDEGRENEGDVVIWAGAATPERVNFLVREARGLVCAPMPPERAAALQLPPMVARNTETFGTAFTVSVDARTGTTTGISAADRSRTLRLLADPGVGPDEFVRPGHIFPLEARPGGVLERAGHTEAAVDLLTMAGLYPVAAICEIMAEDGTMARGAALEAFAARHGLALVHIADVVRERRLRERWVERVGEAALPTRYGDFRAVAFAERLTGEVHLAVVKGEVPTPHRPTLVRIHSECMTGDVFGSLRCDCGDQLHEALRRIEAAQSGVLLYLRQEGRGIGLGAKIRAYALQEQGRDTVEANLELGYPADARDYGVAAQILRDLGVERISLMTNNPDKLQVLADYGVEVVDRVPIEVPARGPFGRRYLETKRDKLGHLLRLDDADAAAASETDPLALPGAGERRSGRGVGR